MRQSQFQRTPVTFKLITLLVSVPSTMLKTCRATAAMMRLSSSA